jgi:hypothetical protein
MELPSPCEGTWSRRSLQAIVRGGLSILVWGAGIVSGYAAETLNGEWSTLQDFSARLTWHAHGKTSKALLYVKGSRYRIEHLGGVKTGLGNASVTIINLDEQKMWYVISHQRLVLAVPLSADYVLPFTVIRPGEIKRTTIGDSMVGDRQAQLYEIVVDHDSHTETLYEWVDRDGGFLLKLMSQDRDWMVEYDHVVHSIQPDYYFDSPLGYRELEAQEIMPQAK